MFNHKQKGESSFIVLITAVISVIILATALIPASNTMTENGAVTFLENKGYVVASPAGYDSNMIPASDNTYDIGSALQSWADIYFDGEINGDGSNLTDVNAYTLDGYNSSDLVGALGASAWVIASNADADILAYASVLEDNGYPVYVCDGTADDIEMQAAIDIGDYVQLSEGTFRTHASPQIKSGTILSGASRSATIISPDSLAIAGITANGVADWSIMDLTISYDFADGELAGSNNSLSTGISILENGTNYCTRFEINRINILYAYDGIKSYAICYMGGIRNIYIQRHSNIGIWIEGGCTTLDIDTVYVDGLGGHPKTGFKFVGITGLQIQNFATDYCIGGASKGYINGCTFAANGLYFESNTLLTSNALLYISNSKGVIQGYYSGANHYNGGVGGATEETYGVITVGTSHIEMYEPKLVNEARANGGYCFSFINAGGTFKIYNTAAYTAPAGTGGVAYAVFGAITQSFNTGYLAKGEVRSDSGTLTLGNTNAIAFAWHNPYTSDIYIKKIVITVTTGGGTIGSQLDVGIADDATGTNRGVEFFDDLLLNNTGIYDSAIVAGGGTQTVWVLCQDSVSVTDGWIVGQILTQNAASLVGSYYIEYVGK